MTESRKKILPLPDGLISQIAAGEVIERPASCLKEFVENSLDAASTKIDINIQDGGMSLIQIEDDGCGIPKDELHLAYARHATSKIRTFDDLFTVKSMGFRGEAVASVGSVSRMDIVSIVENETHAWGLSCEEGKLGSPRPASRAKGTRIDVRDLFFFVPARRKFLKSSSTEANKCVDVFFRIALSRPDVAFSIRRDGKLLYAVPSQSLTQRVGALLGHSLSKPIEYEEGPISVTGLMGEASSVPSTREKHYLYVNGRHVRDKIVNQAFKNAIQAYAPNCQDKDFSLVLFINLPPDDVDVNAHPAKSEVRFRYPQAVLQVISRGLASSLKELRELIKKPAPQTQMNNDHLSMRSGDDDIFEAPSFMDGDISNAVFPSMECSFKCSSKKGLLIFEDNKGLVSVPSADFKSYLDIRSGMDTSRSSTKLALKWLVSPDIDVSLIERLENIGFGFEKEGQDVMFMTERPTWLRLRNPLSLIHSLSRFHGGNKMRDIIVSISSQFSDLDLKSDMICIAHTWASTISEIPSIDIFQRLE